MRSRAYETPDDLRRMQGLVQDAWSLVGPKNERHAGDVPWAATQHVGREPEWRRQLWEENGSRPRTARSPRTPWPGTTTRTASASWSRSGPIPRTAGEGSASGHLFALRRLRDAGAERATVLCRGDAAYAVPRRLYESVGFRQHSRSVVFRKTPKTRAAGS